MSVEPHLPGAGYRHDLLRPRGRASSSTTRACAHKGYRQRGFSLLEVLVAFAILALTLGVLLQIFSRAMNATAISATYSRAVALAEAKLNAVGADIPLEQGVHSGEPEDGMDWIVHIEPYQTGDALDFELPLQPYRITAVASWPGIGGARRVALRSLRLGEPL